MLFTLMMSLVIAVPCFILTGLFVSRSRPGRRTTLRAPDHGEPATEGGGETLYRKDPDGRWMRSDGSAPA